MSSIWNIIELSIQEIGSNLTNAQDNLNYRIHIAVVAWII